MPLGFLWTWEGDLSRLASPDTGLRTRLRKGCGEAVMAVGLLPANRSFPEAIP